jgi:drug/metabolite transporter (DMT)-like permease
MDGLKSPGVAAALLSAVLFGAATPFAKVLLQSSSPWLLAGLLYAGSGIALTVLRWVRPGVRSSLSLKEWFYLSAAIAAGGVVAPVLLMLGLSVMPAGEASLLLNAEGVFTALLAWFVFAENFDRRIALGMLAIAAGAATLSWGANGSSTHVGGSLLVLGACFAWAIDNNLTRKVALVDATWLASIKGLAAGATNLALAVSIGAKWPDLVTTTEALVIGAIAYGASLVLFVTALRQLGTARTTAYFSLAPFAGTLVALVWLREPLTVSLAIAGVLMAIGVWLHLTERHEHVHHHPPLEHEHEHVHDEHHQHSHSGPVPSDVRHSHRHTHESLTHSHHHFPDTHHQHTHKPQ